MLKSSKNYYEILGVTPDVDSVELKTVYRRLVRKFHPDINPGGEVKFKDITEAYETLCDEKLRKRYDTLNGFFKTSKAAENPQETYRNSYKKNTDAQPKDTFEKTNQKETKKESEIKYKKAVKDEKLLTDVINDIIDGFSQAAKKKKTPPKSPKPLKGGDITTDVTITLKESVCGTHKIVNIVHTKVCEHCCGRKFINETKCHVCGGSGEVTTHQKINVTIPPHVKNGAKLRLAGEGKKGSNGGKNGDLYLKITVAPDSTFKVDGINLLCEVPISPCEAVLGGDIEIPSFSGSVVLSLPENTKSGQKFRIASKGLKKNNLVGDIIISVVIQIPDKITDDEIKLYKKLRELSGASLRENLLND